MFGRGNGLSLGKGKIGQTARQIGKNARSRGQQVMSRAATSGRRTIGEIAKSNGLRVSKSTKGKGGRSVGAGAGQASKLLNGLAQLAGLKPTDLLASWQSGAATFRHLPTDPGPQEWEDASATGTPVLGVTLASSASATLQPVDKTQWCDFIRLGVDGIGTNDQATAFVELHGFGPQPIPMLVDGVEEVELKDFFTSETKVVVSCPAAAVGAEVFVFIQSVGGRPPYSDGVEDDE